MKKFEIQSVAILKLARDSTFNAENRNVIYPRERRESISIICNGLLEILQSTTFKTKPPLIHRPNEIIY